MALEQYHQKRKPDQTPEPFGRAPTASARGCGMFVVQKHAARRLHYDFRLQMEGVLRSWAVPKGPSLNPKDRRLAVMVEDHPVEYGDFEGTIPDGNYGAGAVIVWDRGEYRVIDPVGGDAADAVRAGKLDIEMHGFKLRGAFTLVRTRSEAARRGTSDKQQWLLIKKRDESASDDDLLERHPRSVLSGLTLEEMREASRKGGEVSAELLAAQAPQLSDAYAVRSFPLAAAKSVDEPFDGPQWLFELKYDGVRALAIRDGTTTRIFGRSQREITAQYPEIVLALGAMPFERFAIDGEIVVPDDNGRPSFQLLQRRIQVETARQASLLSLAIPVNYWVFDLLAFGDFDLRTMPLEERKRILAKLIHGEGPVRYCDHIVGRGRDFYQAAADTKLEGIIAKKRNSRYQGIRTSDWLKIKCPQIDRFVIGGWTDPAGARSYFGALLAGQYEASGALRFVTRVGSGFDDQKLQDIHALLNARRRERSPFRRARANEPAPPRSTSHFCEPDLVCEIQFGDWTEDGGIRHPVFKGLVDGADPRDCIFRDGGTVEQGAERNGDSDEPDNREPTPDAEPTNRAPARGSVARSESGDKPPNALNGDGPASGRGFKLTNLDKVFWPRQGFTKGNLIQYYETIAPWMLPYLKDRPVVLTRYPNGIDGKSFFQKDAPAFAPPWIRTEKIYSHDSRRDIAYFILETPEAIAYMANMGAIPLHVWASRIDHLERPDWLLFDIDPKNSTTEKAVIVARETGDVLREVGMRPYVKTSGQMGIHVCVGLVPEYTYEQARMFSELVAQIVLKRVPEDATLMRDHAARKGRAYIDYMQLWHGKTIAAPFAVRPIDGAPVSTPITWDELETSLDPAKFNIKSMPPRMERMKTDPFLGVLTDLQRIEAALPRLDEMLRAF